MRAWVIWIRPIWSRKLWPSSMTKKYWKDIMIWWEVCSIGGGMEEKFIWISLNTRSNMDLWLSWVSHQRSRSSTYLRTTRHFRIQWCSKNANIVAITLIKEICCYAYFVEMWFASITASILNWTIQQINSKMDRGMHWLSIVATPSTWECTRMTIMLCSREEDSIGRELHILVNMARQIWTESRTTDLWN